MRVLFLAELFVIGQSVGVCTFSIIKLVPHEWNYKKNAFQYLICDYMTFALRPFSSSIFGLFCYTVQKMLIVSSYPYFKTYTVEDFEYHLRSDDGDSKNLNLKFHLEHSRKWFFVCWVMAENGYQFKNYNALYMSLDLATILISIISREYD